MSAHRFVTALVGSALLTGCPSSESASSKTAAPTTTASAATALPATVRLQGEAYGSDWAVNLVVTSERERLQAATLTAAIDATIAEVARQVSAWDPQSEVRRFSDARHRRPLKASRSTVQIVAVALDVAARSEGAFDPTVGPLLDLWGFSSSTKGTVTTAPTGEAISVARERVGWRHISLEGEMLNKDRDDVSLDVTALGDGAAAAAIAALLGERGCSDFLVDVAGEVVVSGRAERDGGRRDWRVGINTPTTDAAATDSVRQVVLSPSPGALLSLSTSGTYREAWSSDGRRYSHIIDPNTGAPVAHDLVSCTIVGADVVVADALSTACIVMGEARTRAMLAAGADGYEALFIHAPTATTFATTTTATFPPSP